VSLIQHILDMPLVRSVLQHRFMKFGVVGFSGTIVNLVVLFLSQEYLLAGVRPEETRLNGSLALAIFVATVHNFLWNRFWTWKDRKGKTRYPFMVQMGQYFLASWLSIALQFIATKVAAQFMHYLLANVIAIILAAVVTFVLNDIWTFRPSNEAQRHGG
jgi:dolichol-phosphate mannosyltransferase